MYEFEGLLFSDPIALAKKMAMSKSAMPKLESSLQEIRKTFDTPEHINNSRELAPSKRLLKLHPGYKKKIHGIAAANETGLGVIMEKCDLFRAWVDKIKKLNKL